MASKTSKGREQSFAYRSHLSWVDAASWFFLWFFFFWTCAASAQAPGPQTEETPGSAKHAPETQASEVQPSTGETFEDPAATLAQLRAVRLDTAHPLAVENLRLDIGAAELHLRRGTLFVARQERVPTAEMVFLGEGTVHLDPPDEVEAGQLELFTGGRQLRADFSEAVLVIARDVAAEALLSRPAAPERSAELERRATARYEAWRQSTERRRLQVEVGLLLDALGDPLFESLFAGWFDRPELDPFLLLVNPNEREQITLGQFVKPEVSDSEERQLIRHLHRQQRRGRLIGLKVDDLGIWDSWVSTSLPAQDGQRRYGSPAFEPTHYRLDVHADPRSGKLEGQAQISVQSLTGQRAVALNLHGDLELREVRDAEGRPLYHYRSGEEIWVLLEKIPEVSSETTLEVRWEGRFFDKGEGRTWALRDGISWYPHCGAVDRATYDVTLRWPRKFELVASGKLIEQGEEKRTRWERRTLDVPTYGFSFEIGRFEIETFQVGHVAVRVAFDPTIRDLSAGTLNQITHTLTDSLLFFEEIFGPYPLDGLTVVTVPRDYSQAMLGFVTLSNLMVADWGFFGSLLGFEDRRTVIAHEIAHQWWGHQVGWASYRDQWISEAMANYAALLWARRRLHGQLAVGPTSGWQRLLTATLDDGRPLEALGPLVLGERLESSRSLGTDAYLSIVYRKGAVVLDMLARSLGEKRFVAMLHTMVEHVAGRVISTEVFLEILERLSGADLGPFGRQYIYGTGLPEVVYRSQFEPLPHGQYRVRITAEQEAPYRFRYAVVESDDSFDIARMRLDQMEVESSQLAVPFQILLAAPGDDLSPKGPRQILTSHMMIEGKLSEHELVIEGTPERLWLDRHRQVFGRFSDAGRLPKANQLRQGLDLIAAGQPEESIDKLHEALTTPIFDSEGQRDRSSERLVDARTHLALAQAFLDTDRLEEAEASLLKSREALPRAARWWLEDAFNLAQARLEIRLGQTEAAFRRLRKSVLKQGRAEDAEPFLLLAIAAQATGHRGEFQEALEEAKRRGADVSLLERKL